MNDTSKTCDNPVACYHGNTRASFSMLPGRLFGHPSFSSPDFCPFYFPLTPPWKSSSFLLISAPSPMSLFLSRYHSKTLPFFNYPITLFPFLCWPLHSRCSLLKSNHAEIQHWCHSVILSRYVPALITPPLPVWIFKNHISSDFCFPSFSSFLLYTLTHHFQNPYGQFQYKTGYSKPEHICVLWSLTVWLKEWVEMHICEHMCVPLNLIN